MGRSQAMFSKAAPTETGTESMPLLLTRIITYYSLTLSEKVEQ